MPNPGDGAEHRPVDSQQQQLLLRQHLHQQNHRRDDEDSRSASSSPLDPDSASSSLERSPRRRTASSVSSGSREGSVVTEQERTLPEQIVRSSPQTSSSSSSSYAPPPLFPKESSSSKSDSSSSAGPSLPNRGHGYYLSTGERGGSGLSFYKRQKTSSPPTSIDEGDDTQDGDAEGASDKGSSVVAGEQQAASPASSLSRASPSHRQRQVPNHGNSGTTTPLRFSFGSTFTVGQGHASSSIPDSPMTTTEDDASLPSYSEAMEQSVELRPHSPALPASGVADPAQSLSADVPPSVQQAPTPSEQLAKVKALKDLPLKEGDAWAVLQRSWLKRWSTKCATLDEAKGKADVEAEELEVGPVDTADLADVAHPGALKTGIEEGIDFEVVPSELFELLTRWYGRRGPLFERKVVSMPASDALRIELYHPVLEVYPILAPGASRGASTSSGVIMTSLSTLKRLADVKAAVLKQMPEAERQSLGPGEMRFWRLPADAAISSDSQGRAEPSIGPSVPAEALQAPGVELIAESKDTLTLAELQIDQAVEKLALEVRQKGAAWAFDQDGKLVAPATQSVKGIFAQDGGDYLSKMQAKQAESTDVSSVPISQQRDDASTSASSGSIFGSTLGRVTRSQTAADRGAEKQHGTTGLYNLGNTCFMNAALQCMSNTPELKDYFVTGVYKSEINADNPLGMGGAIAKVFGELLTKLWNSGGGAWHPREFKMVLSRFSPQFIGYQQQDTQELLAFLLDGLHEDLNRIVKKPYIEAPDWEGGGMLEMVKFARKQWEIYKLRNDSVIVDLFQGQYKSTLVCPECGKVSIKFDPFMYLTLPIPNRKVISRKLTFIPWDQGKPIRDVKLRVTGDSSMGKIKERLARWFDTDPKQLLIVDFFKGCFYKVYSDYDSMSEVADSDITFVYEVPTAIRSVAPPPSQFSFGRGDGIEEAEGKHEYKQAAASNLEESVVLPVFSASGRVNGGERQGYMSRASNDFVAFGLPFFVSVPKKQANDPTAIQEAILRRYQAVVKDCKESQVVSECLEGLRDIKSGASTPEDWDMLDDTSATTANGTAVVDDAAQNDVVLPLDSQDEETITEISNDGQTVNIIPGQQKQGQEQEHALASQNGAAGKKSKSKQLFSIFFSINRDDRAPIPLKAHRGDDSGEELTARLQRIGGAPRPHEAAKNVDIDSEMGSPGEDSAEEQASVEKELSSTSSTNHTWPLVYPGGALTCVWSPNIKKRVFDDDSSESLQAWDTREVEPFLDPEIQAAIDEKQKAGGKRTSNLTIEDCLDEFTREEKLGEEDPWYCPQCKDFRQATKKFDLWKVPDILVVHLKRFRGGRVSRDKIDANVDFPVKELNLEDRVEGAKAVRELEASGESLASSMTLSIQDGDEEDPLTASITSDANDDAVASDKPIYDLYAVDHHYGGLGGGHYTASAMNPEDNKWYYFDDSSVRPISNVDEVKGPSAYLLFYRRRTTRPIGGKSREKVVDAVSQTMKGGNDEASSSAAAQGSSVNGPSTSVAGFGHMDGGGGGGEEVHDASGLNSENGGASSSAATFAPTSPPGAWGPVPFDTYADYMPNEEASMFTSSSPTVFPRTDDGPTQDWDRHFELNNRQFGDGFGGRSSVDNEDSWSDGAAEAGSSVGGASSGSTATSELSAQSPEDFSARRAFDDGESHVDLDDDVVVTTDAVHVVGEEDRTIHAASSQSPSLPTAKQSAPAPVVRLPSHVPTASAPLATRTTTSH